MKPLIRKFDAAATEELFRQTFYQDGRRLRVEAWTAVSVFALVIGCYFTFSAHSPVERSVAGPLFLIAMALTIVLGYLSQTAPLPRNASAAIFIAAVCFQVAILMAVRIALYRTGHEPLPVTYPMALSLVLIVTQLRLVVVAPTIVSCVVLIFVAEAVTMPMDAVERNTAVLCCAIAVASLVSVYRVELTSRSAFDTGRRYAALANTDGLTSISNRRYAEQRLHTAVGSPHLWPVSLAILDLDDFKSYNDTHGHPAGDRHLQLVAAALRDSARPDEFVARHAGEEFTVLFTRTDRATAIQRTEELRAVVANVSAAPSPSRPTTASAGIATLTNVEDAGAAAQSLIHAADRALYRAKATGRDRTIAQLERVPIGPSTHAALAAPAVVDIATATTLRTRWGRMYFSSIDIERRFRQAFEHQGRGTRLVLAAATLAALIATVTLQTWLLDTLTPREQEIRFSLIACDVLALGLAIIVARIRARRFGPHLHILAITLLVAGLATQRLAVPVGSNLVPFLAPVAVLVSLALVQIRQELLLPSIAVLGGVMLTAEALVLPTDAMRLIAHGVGAMVIAIVARFSYAMERLQRVDWERTRLMDELSRTDLVTGLPNRRAFTAALRSRLAGAEPVALLLLDVDHLKIYNDRFGHAEGDRFLVAMGHALSTVIGPDDTPARLGGEEFAVLLAGGHDGSGSDRSHSWEDRADQIRIAVGTDGAPGGDSRAVVTASAGLAVNTATQLDDVEATIEDLFERADHALYQAKRRGRNQVVIAPPRTQPGPELQEARHPRVEHH